MNKNIWQVKRQGQGNFGVFHNGVLIEGGFFNSDVAREALAAHRADAPAPLPAPVYTVGPTAAIGHVRQFAVYRNGEVVERGFFVKAAAELAALQHARGTRHKDLL